MSGSGDESVPLLEIRHLSRRYSSPRAPDVVALDDVNLQIEQGEFVAIVGPSGGGKSTLLNMLGLLDFPDEGEYLLNGVPVPPREGTESSRIRSTEFAFIFQSFHLLQSRPVRDSVELGLMYRGVIARNAPATSALERVGLADRAEERASHLSGGQQQRVAIARAIASSARIIFADEPTGNLDSENAQTIISELHALNRAGTTVIVVTHSENVAAAAHRQLHIQDGRLVSDTRHRQLPCTSTAVFAASTQAVADVRCVAQSSPTSSFNVLLGGAHEDATEGDESGQRPARPRLRTRDVLRDAWRSVRSRPAQTVALGLAVSIAVALTLTTLGISTSAGAQVSSAFDAQLNREVTATWDNDPHSSAAALADVPERTEKLAGVDAAAALADFDPVTVTGVSEGRAIQPHTYAGDIEAAARLTIRQPAWRTPGPLAPNEVFIGSQLATLLELSPLDSGPIVTINHRAFQVAGIIEQSPRLPLLKGEILLADNAPGLDSPKTISAVLLSSAGAAQQVARQTPIAINSYAPETVTVQAPTDATGLRVTVEQGVQATLIAFSILAIVVAIAALSNAMLLAVTARRGEIGMRKALGARSSHVAWLLAGESAYIGAAGGVLGLAIGILAILVITLIQKWTPVFDLRLGPLAVVAGTLIGILGGVMAAARAAKIRPSDTLRQ